MNISINKKYWIIILLILITVFLSLKKIDIGNDRSNIVSNDVIKKDKISINFVGDIFLTKKMIRRYENEGINGIISEKYKKYLDEADYNIANLECALTDDLEDIQDKQYTLAVPRYYVKCFKELKFNLFTLANNHSMDYGKKGLEDTFETLKSNEIEYIGAGMTMDEARTPLIKDIGGRKIAFIAMSQVVPSESWLATYSSSGICNTYNGTNYFEIIKKIKEKVDKVIVYIHWGKELEATPNEVQKITAYNLIDAGVDMIVGSHPHIPQCIEFYKGAPIAYSLGNFIYGMTERETMLLNLIIDFTENSTGKLILKKISGVSSYEKVIDYWDKEEIIQDIS